MKIIKKILLVIVAIIALLLIVALFIKNEYSVEREITINKPKEDVFSYIKLLKNQDYYSKWIMTDPSMKKDFRGTDGTTGFVYAWDSNNKNAGKGEQEIKNIVEGERTDVEVRFERPMKGVANVHMITEAVSPAATKVKWGMQGRNPYPLNIMNLFVPSILGGDIQKSLENLKANLEK